MIQSGEIGKVAAIQAQWNRMEIGEDLFRSQAGASNKLAYV